MPERRKLAAYLLPMATFVALLALNSVLKKTGDSFWLRSAEYWIYPAQTILCGGLLIWFCREYKLVAPRHYAFAAVIGVIVFLAWVSPPQFFGASPRTLGFNPDVLKFRPSIYWMTIVLRFIRLAVVVPFIEEIFWRGFLLRFLIDENFERIPVGTFSWVSFAVVTVGFGFSHAPEDWVVALLTGALYNGVAYRTKNLSSCILTHAVTNLLLGFWIMTTKQWGFW